MNFTIDCFSCCCCRWCWCGFFKEKFGRERERKKEANLVKTKGAKQRQARQGSLPLILKCYASTVVRHLLPNCLYSSLPLSHTHSHNNIYSHTHTLSLSLSLSQIHIHINTLFLFSFSVFLTPLTCLMQVINRLHIVWDIDSKLLSSCFNKGQKIGPDIKSTMFYDYKSILQVIITANAEEVSIGSWKKYLQVLVNETSWPVLMLLP